MQSVLLESAGALSLQGLPTNSQVCKRQAHLCWDLDAPPFVPYPSLPTFCRSMVSGIGSVSQTTANSSVPQAQSSSSRSPFALFLSTLLPCPHCPCAALCCHPTLPEAGSSKPPPSGLLPLVIQQPSQVECLSQTPLSSLEEDCRVSQSWSTPASSVFAPICISLHEQPTAGPFYLLRRHPLPRSQVQPEATPQAFCSSVFCRL